MADDDKIKPVAKTVVGQDAIITILEGDKGDFYFSLKQLKKDGGKGPGGTGDLPPVEEPKGGEGGKDSEDEGGGGSIDDFLGDAPEDFDQPEPIIPKQEGEIEGGYRQGGRGGTDAGAGEGLDIAPPAETPFAYTYYKEMAEVNQRHIKKMLHILHIDLKTKYFKENWMRVGRIMSQVLPRAVLQSRHRPVDNIYVRNRVLFQRKEVMVMILCDVSGSVEQAEQRFRNALVILSEVASKWLPDGNFAIYWFAGDIQRIKSFEDAYATARYRLGAGSKNDPQHTRSVWGGGTVVSIPVKKLGLEWRKTRFRTAPRKMFILISDFAFDHDAYPYLQKEFTTWRDKMGVITVLIANDPNSSKASDSGQRGVVERARCIAGNGPAGEMRRLKTKAMSRPCAYIVNMPNIDSLPLNYVKVYEKIANDEKLPSMSKSEETAIKSGRGARK